MFIFVTQHSRGRRRTKIFPPQTEEICFCLPASPLESSKPSPSPIERSRFQKKKLSYTSAFLSEHVRSKKRQHQFLHCSIRDIANNAPSSAGSVWSSLSLSLRECVLGNHLCERLIQKERRKKIF
ncbi:hypothetical protein KP509_1Z212200 [Ceratopteris richardii]|nr:hypothetical protein KP509_1Z212200 [Ceratopteris richardii]KAH6555987.1 hypothetical protein KP509_1Z212200 [Ceratopteris richardii]